MHVYAFVCDQRKMRLKKGQKLKVKVLFLYLKAFSLQQNETGNLQEKADIFEKNLSQHVWIFIYIQGKGKLKNDGNWL